MMLIVVIAMAWITGNLMYYIAPAARERYRWACANLQLVQIVVTLLCGLIVSVNVWGKAQLH